MPRPKNEELKTQIERAAWAQFRAQGYNATTYATIGRACGISRALAQYHFPKKELLAMSFMEDVLARAQASMGLADEEVVGDFAAITEIGCRFFEEFLAEEGMRMFFLDILESRELSLEVLAFDAGWALARSGSGLADVPEEAMRSVVSRMGGFYELLYYCLKNGLSIDVRAELPGVVEAFAAALN